MLRNNKIIKIVLGLTLFVSVCLTTAFTVKYSYLFVQNYFTPDFEFYSDEDDPQIGEIINLQGLKDKNGESFQNKKHKGLILMGVVDPECGACLVAKDQINWIQEGIKQSDVEYIFVSFTSDKSLDEFSSYTKKHYKSTNSFLWENSSSITPKSLLTTVVPSHILINSDGKILKTFFGTRKDKSLRERMAKKIIEEVITTSK